MLRFLFINDNKIVFKNLLIRRIRICQIKKNNNNVIQ